MPGPVGVEKFATGFVGALVSMCAKVVALRLQQVGRQPFGVGGMRRAKPDLPVTVDLTEQRVTWGNQSAPFTIDAVWREQLLNGWDDVQVTQSFAGAISTFKTADAAARPWMRPAKGS